MTVDDALISHLARLARLEFDAAQTSTLRGDLVDILAMVEKLDELDLDGVAPLRYVTEVENILRPDAVGRHLERERALGNAPAADEAGGFFKVPRVID